MNGLKIATAALVAILLFMTVIDRSRQTEQLADLKKTLDVLNATLQQIGQQGARQAPLQGAPASSPVPGGRPLPPALRWLGRTKPIPPATATPSSGSTSCCPMTARPSIPSGSAASCARLARLRRASTR